MIIFIFLILSSLITGLFITYKLNLELFFGERITYGSIISFSFFIQLIYLFTFLSGFNYISNSFAILSIFLISIFSIFNLNKIKDTIKNDFSNFIKNIDTIFSYILTFWFAVFSILFSKNFFFKSDGIYSNTTTDLPVHLAFINSFLYGENFPHKTPLYAGEKLAYPFLSDYFSAFLISCGMPQDASLNYVGIFMCLLITSSIYFMTLRITENKFSSNLSSFILFLGGSLGFWKFFEKDLPSFNYNIFETLKRAPNLYTDQYEYNFQFFNFIIGYLLPQRSFIFGFPLGITIISLMWIFLKSNKKEYLLLAGFTAGILPLFHFHSFMNIMIIASFLFVLFFKKEKEYIKNWFYFGLISSLLAIPQISVAVTRVTRKTELFKTHIGWMANNKSYFWFWLKNTGFTWFLIFESIFNKSSVNKENQLNLDKTNSLDNENYDLKEEKKYLSFDFYKKDLFKLYIPFLFLFIIANLISFSPCWIGDNAKVIFFWFVGSVPFISLGLVKLFNHSKLLATTLFITLILSGTLDISRFVFTDTRIFKIWSNNGILISEKIKEKISPKSVFLTAPVYYSPVFLSGRQVLMGNSIHVCTQGIDKDKREYMVTRIFESDSIDEKFKYINDLNPDYALVGEPERRLMKNNKTFFEDNFELEFKVGTESVFNLKRKKIMSK